ncbi:redoxin domain-containing protein [Amycolatopsis granulosa]|uniref:redoxin domain-containing protein n=1 Tax=Amycolatopsis granulosa TaxID=185684 RepID=UPI00141FBD69|nr:peroxiredoxin [Amycolatopsis granulosa]
MIEPGSPAPEMVLEDTEGRTVRVSDFAGPVLLYFMRSTSCPVCQRHVRDLAERDDLTGVRVLVVVPEDRAEAAAWKARRRIPFPVLTSPRGTPHEMVGLNRKLFGSMQQSGSVLIDGEGIVRHAHGATLPTGGYDRKGIAAALRTPA